MEPVQIYGSNGQYAHPNNPSPMLNVSAMFPGQGTILAKLEGVGPGMSVKGRPARGMIEAAYDRGLIVPGEFSFNESGQRVLTKPGTLIVEGSSGNMGVEIARYAIPRGHPTVIFAFASADAGKKEAILATGAKLCLVDSSKPYHSPVSYEGTPARLAKDLNGWAADQFNNPDNTQAHYDTTGPEIWVQTEGRITHFVGGMGTGGTLSGTVQYLREQNPHIQGILADPMGSALKEIFDYLAEHGKDAKVPDDLIAEAISHTQLTRGVGNSHLTGNMNGLEQVTDAYKFNDADAFSEARNFSQLTGYAVGGSSGGALSVARQIAPSLEKGEVMVVLLADSGADYGRSVYDNTFVEENGLFVPGNKTPSIEAMLESKPVDLKNLIVATPDQTLAEIVSLMDEHDLSQLPVRSGDRFVGSVIYDTLTHDRYDKDTPLGDLDDFKDRATGFEQLDTIAYDGSPEELDQLLRDNAAVLVTKNKQRGAVNVNDVVGILTWADYLGLANLRT